MQTKFGFLRTISYPLQIEFLQKISQNLRIGQNNLGLKSTSNMDLANTEFVIHFHMRKPWFYPESSMLEVILIPILQVLLEHWRWAWVILTLLMQCCMGGFG